MYGIDKRFHLVNPLKLGMSTVTFADRMALSKLFYRRTICVNVKFIFQTNLTVSNYFPVDHCCCRLYSIKYSYENSHLVLVNNKLHSRYLAKGVKSGLGGKGVFALSWLESTSLRCAQNSSINPLSLLQYV